MLLISLFVLAFLGVIHRQYSTWPSTNVRLQPCIWRSEGVLAQAPALSEIFRAAKQ